MRTGTLVSTGKAGGCATRVLSVVAEDFGSGLREAVEAVLASGVFAGGCGISAGNGGSESSGAAAPLALGGVFTVEAAGAGESATNSSTS